MCLVNNNEIRSIIQEEPFIFIGFNIVYTNDHMAIIVVEADVTSRDGSFQSCDVSRLNYHSINIELFGKLLCPLSAQMRGANHCNSFDHSPV